MKQTQTTNSRQNISQIKQHIDKKLGQFSGIYWENFTKFLRAKISKQEWDYILKQVINAGVNSTKNLTSTSAPSKKKKVDIVAMHNYFVKCLLHNARFSNQTTTSHIVQNRGISKQRWASSLRLPFRRGVGLLRSKFFTLSKKQLSLVGINTTLPTSTNSQNLDILQQLNTQLTLHSSPLTSYSSNTSVAVSMLQLIPRPIALQSIPNYISLDAQAPGQQQTNRAQTLVPIPQLEITPEVQYNKLKREDLVRLGLHFVETKQIYHSNLASAMTQKLQYEHSLLEPVAFDKDNITYRMKKIAEDNGLQRGISSDCIALIQRAMEIHLKNILEKCLEAKRLMQQENLEQETEELVNEKLIFQKKVEKGVYYVKNTMFSNPNQTVYHSYVHYPDEIEPFFEYEEEEIDKEPSKELVVASSSSQIEFRNKLSKIAELEVETKNFAIRPRDLLNTLESHPKLLGDASERFKEKLLLSDWDL